MKTRPGHDQVRVEYAYYSCGMRTNVNLTMGYAVKGKKHLHTKCTLNKRANQTVSNFIFRRFILIFRRLKNGLYYHLPQYPPILSDPFLLLNIQCVVKVLKVWRFPYDWRAFPSKWHVNHDNCEGQCLQKPTLKRKDLECTRRPSHTYRCGGWLPKYVWNDLTGRATL